eukprot:scaffold5359_cov131-Isochrysis_galbana.AAC.8
MNVRLGDGWRGAGSGLGNLEAGPLTGKERGRGVTAPLQSRSLGARRSGDARVGERGRVGGSGSASDLQEGGPGKERNMHMERGTLAGHATGYDRNAIGRRDAGPRSEHDTGTLADVGMSVTVSPATRATRRRTSGQWTAPTTRGLARPAPQRRAPQQKAPEERAPACPRRC